MVTDTDTKRQYTANGTSTEYPYAFKVIDSAHLVVILSDRSR